MENSDTKLLRRKYRRGTAVSAVKTRERPVPLSMTFLPGYFDSIAIFRRPALATACLVVPTKLRMAQQSPAIPAKK